jgi:hypothetical protein
MSGPMGSGARAELAHALGVRKVSAYTEDTFIEGKPGAPVRLAGVAAVIANPWAGLGFVENLRPEILSIAPRLAELLVPQLLELCGGGDTIEAYGKAAIVGTNGEVEHASAFIHTLRFGNRFRSAVGGTTYLSFTNIRAGAGAPISIPMMHKLDEGLRSHYLTLNVVVQDAPGPDEIVVAIGASTGGRLHPRIGNRYIDMAELEAEAAAASPPSADSAADGS